MADEENKFILNLFRPLQHYFYKNEKKQPSTKKNRCIFAHLCRITLNYPSVGLNYSAFNGCFSSLTQDIQKRYFKNIKNTYVHVRLWELSLTWDHMHFL